MLRRSRSSRLVAFPTSSPATQASPRPARARSLTAALAVVALGIAAPGPGFRPEASTAVPPDSLTATHAQKPVRTVTSREGNRSRMQSLDQIWAAAAIVIEAQFGPCRPVVFSTPANPRPSPQSACNVRVLEVFKGDEVVREPGSAITVRQPGGEFDRGDHIERIVPASRPLYEAGSRYFLFLRRHTLPTETFYSTSSLDADGIYKLTGQAVEAASAKEWTRALAQQGPDAFRQALRDRGRVR